tara:strand:+ start:2354 stop:2821 length:468 start_codon:yes stop_codon:yes gene_type:complete
MKKTKYYYVSYYQQYEIGDAAYLTRREILNFYDQTGVKLHVEMKPCEDPNINREEYEIGYTWEFVEDDKLPQFFQFVGSEEVDIKPTVTKLPSHNRYKNGYNWKAHKKAMNPSLQKPKSRTIEEEKKKNDLLWVEYKNTRQARLNKKSKKKRSDS